MSVPVPQCTHLPRMECDPIIYNSRSSDSYQNEPETAYLSFVYIMIGMETKTYGNSHREFIDSGETLN